MATAIFSVAGSYTWVCPAGVTSVQIECVGTGGGNGLVSSGYAMGGGGGGGGAYARKNSYTVTPGQSYNIVVGGRDVYHNGLPSTFIYSSVTVCKADGGSDGGGAAGGVGGAGGSGGSTSNCVGDIKYGGGRGADGASGSFVGGGGGSSGGSASAGNPGSGTSGGAAVSGGGPGGTGGTAADGATPVSGPGGGCGGNGDWPGSFQLSYDGQVIITYTLPSVSYTIPKATLAITGHAPTLSLYAGRAFNIPRASLTITSHAPSLTFVVIWTLPTLVKWPRTAWYKAPPIGVKRLSDLSDAELAALTNEELAHLEN